MKHLFTLSERLRGELVKMVNLVMQFLKATKRQSDTTIFAKSLKSLKSLMSIFAESVKVSKFHDIFANYGVKDVRVSLEQQRTNIQRISNLYLTPNRYFTRFATVFALVFVMGVGNVWGDPVVLFHETFGNNTGSARDWNNSYSVKSGVSAVYSGITYYTVSNAKQGKNTTGSTQSGLNQTSQGTDAYIIIGPLSVASYSSLGVTYQWKAASIKGTYTTKLYYATSSGESYTEVNGTGTGATSFVERSYSLPVAAQVSTLYLKIVWNTSNTQAIIDEVELTGTAAASTPTITTSVSSLSEVGYNTADFSQQMKSFTVSGSNLTTNVTVTAPTNYEVCKTSDGTYTSSVSFDKGSGTLATSTVYVRLQSGKTANNYSGNVECTSSGATTKNVALSGSVPFTVTWKANGTAHATTYVAYATGTGTALGSLPTDPDPEDYSCTGNAFFGWYDGEAYSHASTAPSVISTSTKITSNKTYNAVFAKTEGESASKTYELIISYTDFVNAGGYGANDGEHSSTATATDASGATMEVEWVSSNVMRGASPNDTKMQFRNTPGYIYNTTDLGTINSISLTNGSKVSNIKGSSQNPSSAGTPASYFRIVGTSGSGNTGYATSATINFTKTTDNTTYSNFATSCCQPLAQIKGSIYLDQLGNGKLQATWDEQTSTNGWADPGIVIKIYEEGNATPVVTSSALANNTTSFTATDFTPKKCTQYYATLTATHGTDASYCAGDLVSAASEKITTAGYSYTITLTNDLASISSGGTQTTTCDGNYSAVFAAISGYDLPGTISVTNAGSLNNGYTWNQASGALTIDASKVIGDVAVTITATVKACTPLGDPEVTVSGLGYPYDGVTLSWEAIEHADGYIVEIWNGSTKVEDDALDAGSTTYEVQATLLANTKYTYKVQATSETPATYCASNVVTDDFDTEDYPTATLTLSEVGGEDYNLSGSHKLNDVVKLPSTLTYAGCTGKVLVGWSSVAIETPGAKPTSNYWDAGADYTLSSTSGKLYAVYATETPGSTSWDETALSSLGAGDVFVIVGNNGSNYAMTNNNGTSDPPAASGVTVSSTHLTGTIADNIKWNISGNATDGYVFYPNGSTLTWLYCTNTNNGVRVGTGDAKHFTLNQGYLYETETSDNRYLGIYSSQDWRCYTSSGGNIANQTFKYYKLNVTAAVYSNYTTACAAALANPTFDPAEDAEEEYLAAQNLTISGPTGATIYYTMTTDGTEPDDPTDESDEYSSAISMNSRATYWIKAFAKKGTSVSEIVEAKYNINLPFTVAEAISIIPNNNDERAKTYIDGIVCTAATSLSSGAMTYYISDDGTETNRIRIYSGKGLNNANFSATTDLKIGDKVRVYGKLNNYSGSYDVDNSYLTSLVTATVSSIEIGGTATKTAYTAGDNTFSYAGLTATATYNTGYVKDVTSEATWKANSVTSYTVTETENVSVTATYGGQTSDATVVGVTYTTKTVKSIYLEYESTYTYKGMALPKPKVYAKYVEEIADEEITSLVEAASGYDTESTYNKDVVDTYTIKVAYQSKEATYTVEVRAIFNDVDHPYTPSEATTIIVEAIGENQSSDYIYVAGKVSAIDGSIDNNTLKYYISNDGTTTDQLYVYKGKYINDANFTSYNILVVGDEVVVKAKAQNYEGNLPELKSSQVMKHYRAPQFTFANIVAGDEFEYDHSPDLAVTPTQNSGDVAFTLESDDESIVSIVDGKLHAAGVGTTKITASREATNLANQMNYSAKTAEFYVTVIAKRTRYAITFDANGGSGDDPVIANQLEGATVELPACSYSWAKHGFTGWTVINQSTSVEVEVTDGHFLMPAADVTVQAQWEEIATTHIVFNVNGNTETVEAVDVPQAAEYSITQVTDGQNGYEFVGWAENPETEDVEKAIATIESYTPEAGEASKTLYAVFKRVDEGAPKTDVLTAADFPATTNGYVEFSNVQKNSAAKYAGKTAKNGENIQINEKSKQGIYSSVSGGTLVSIRIQMTSNTKDIGVYGSNTGFTGYTSIPSQEGVVEIEKFANKSDWTITPSSDYKYVGITSATDGAKQISSISITWQPKTTYYTTAPSAVYAVSYVLGEGGAWQEDEGCDGANVKAGQTFDICESVPVREHYKFNGWTVGGNVVSGTITINAETAITAVWEPKVEKDITYNAGTGTGDDAVVGNNEEGAEIVLPSAADKSLIKDGYDFVGWLYGGDLYEAGTTFEMPASAVTFVAQWKKQNTTKMTLVTDASQLVDGSKVVIVSKDPVSNKETRPSAIAGPMSGTNKFFASVTEGLTFNGDNTISYNAETAIELTLDKVDGGWALRSGDNYLAHVSGQNQVKWQSDIAIWNISFSGNNATIKFSDNYSIQYNASSGSERFSAYANAQNTVQLYASLTAITGDASISEIGYVEGDVIVVSSGATLTIDAPSAPASITVKENAVVNVSAATEAGTVIVEKGAKLDIEEGGSVTTNEPLILYTTLGKGTGTSTSGNAPGSSSEIINAERLNATGDVYLEIELTQDAKASAGWYAFSVPFPVDAMNGVYYGDTKLTNEVGYAIMSHYGELRAKDEYAWKKFRGIMQPGVFYVITVGNTDYKTLRFKKVKDEALVASSSVAVSPFPSQTGSDTDAAWNGIGNPNLAISNLFTSVPVMQFYDHKTNTFIGRSHSVNLVVGSAFFIQYNGGETVSIPVGTTSNNGYLAPQRERQMAEEMIYEVQLTNAATGELEDNVFLTAREDATNEYEIGRDVAKMSMGAAKCAQMYVPAYGTNLCAADFQLVNNKAAYPLTITAPAADSYRISSQSSAVSDQYSLYLTYEGAIIWNLSMGACEIELAKGQTDGYGLILVRKAPSVATGVEEVQSDNVQCTKVIIDEHVYILRGGEMYDVTGKAVK